jgi:LytS/YehU family sensor histidine kinase
VLVCAIHPALYTGLDRLIGRLLDPRYSFHYRYGYAFVEGQAALPFGRVWWYVVTYYVTSLVFFYACVVAFVSARRSYQLLRRSELDRLHLESGLAQARLHLLTMQLHPHFLFNTLNSISELMYEDVAAAERMIARLSELLRLALAQRDSALVTLGQEIENLGIYLEIEKIRFQDRLVVEFEIAPDARQCLVPFLILQPLVENAVRHGISRLNLPGRIAIRACRNADHLQLDLCNDIPSDIIKRPTEGLGLRNTRDRLQALYEGDYRFEYRVTTEGQWAVHLEIPATAGEVSNGDE